MKIYKLDVDINRYQSLLPVSDDDSLFDNTLVFKGYPKLDTWKSLSFYIDNPLDKEANFFALFNSSALVCDKNAADMLAWYWGMCGELLPMELEDGRKMFILNVLDCPNVLDKENTEYDCYDDGTRSNRIIKYSFHKNRFHESSIFKIPETAKTEILTYTGVKASEDEFYNAYHESGLQGLTFEEVYCDEP